MTTSLQIVEHRVADVTIIRLTGRVELDEGTTLLRDHINGLLEEGRINLVLDMKYVTRVDSAGVGIMVGKFLSTRRLGGTIKFLHLTERTSRLLRITRLTTVFEIFDNERAAMQSFGVTA